MKFEFYNGFQKSPQIDNRFGNKLDKNGYYPCRLVGVFNLLEIFDNYEILEKLNSIIKLEKDDPSVINYFRKPKLDILNNLT